MDDPTPDELSSKLSDIAHDVFLPATENERIFANAILEVAERLTRLEDAQK